MSKSKRKPGRPRTKISKDFDTELVEAAKKVGFTKEQIAAVKDEESLRALIAEIRPGTLKAVYPPAPKELTEPTIPDPVKMVTTQQTFDIQLSPQSALTWKRGDYEQSELDRFIARNGIKKQNIVRVIITQKYVPNETSKYETEFRIIYKEPK